MNKLSHLEKERWPVRLSCVSLIFAFTLICCSPSVQDASSLEEGERKDIQSAVINRFNEMIKYAEAGELENLLAYFDPEGTGSYIDGPTRYATFREMADSYRPGWKVLKQDFGNPDTKVFVLSPDFVLVTSNSMVSTIHKDGVIFQPRGWSITTLWQRKGGQWLIHSFQQFTGEAIRLEEKPA